MSPLQSSNIIRLAAILAAVRIVGVWFWALVASQQSGASQVIGYFWVLLSLPESLLVRALRDRPLLWAAALTALLAVGSLFWVWLLARLRYRWRTSPR
jgi:hypothetical protein